MRNEKIRLLLSGKTVVDLVKVTSRGAKRREVMSKCPFGTGVSSTNLAKSWKVILFARTVAEAPRPVPYVE